MRQQITKTTSLLVDEQLLRDAWANVVSADCSLNSARGGSAYCQPTRYFDSCMGRFEKSAARFQRMSKRFATKYGVSDALEMSDMILMARKAA